MPRKRKPAIEDRPFLGRLGAILSGEGTQRVKRDARKLSSIVRPEPAKRTKRKKTTAKKQTERKHVKRYLY
jgi:hypothetical protein